MKKHYLIPTSAYVYIVGNSVICNSNIPTGGGPGMPPGTNPGDPTAPARKLYV